MGPSWHRLCQGDGSSPVQVRAHLRLPPISVAPPKLSHCPQLLSVGKAPEWLQTIIVGAVQFSGTREKMEKLIIKDVSYVFFFFLRPVDVTILSFTVFKKLFFPSEIEENKFE